MKVPLSFGSSLFLRMLVPGAIASLGFLPGVFALAAGVGPKPDLTTTWVVAILVLGWIATIADLPIYKTLEGRNWPSKAFNWGRDRQQKKVDRLLTQAERAGKDGNPLKSTELYILAYRYPVGGGDYPPASGLPGALVPTELGNVIYGYETYPTVKYGVDGVFFWDRIWLGLDKDVRVYLDDRQALCDGAVYSCFICLVNTLLFMSYWIADYFFSQQILLPESTWEHIVLSLTFLLASYLFYRCAIVANYQFGERIKAMFDTNLDKLGIEGALEVIAMKTQENLSDKLMPHKTMAAWRYLRWHLYRPPESANNVDIETVKSNAKKNN